MRKLIHIEGSDRQPRPFWTSAGLLLLAIPRILVIVLTRELYSATDMTKPLSVLDTMRSSIWPSIRVMRDNCIILSNAHYADGFEVVIRRRGFTWTWRVGRVGAFIASREDYLRHYGAESLSGQGRSRKAA